MGSRREKRIIRGVEFRPENYYEHCIKESSEERFLHVVSEVLTSIKVRTWSLVLML